MSDVFFGLQLAVQWPTRQVWSQQWAELVRRHQRGLAIGEQRLLLSSAARLLRTALPRTSLAFWDYVESGGAEFDDWTRGIEDDADEPWQPDRSGAALDHVLATVVLLVAEDSADGRALAYGCDLPEARWRQRGTYARLVDLLGRLSCTHVRRAAIYLTPGDPALAFSLRELQDQGYDYLLPIE